MNENKNALRRRLLTVMAVLMAISTLIGAGLLLSGCGKKKTPPSGTTIPSQATTVPGSGTVSSGSDHPGSSPAVLPSGDNTPTSSGSSGTDVNDGGTVYCSPSSICMGDNCYYLADATGEAVYKMSLDGKKLKTVQLEGLVSKVYKDGANVYVLAGELTGKLYVLDENLEKKAQIPVGHTPVDLYINGSTAYVANRFSNSVSVVDLSAGKELTRISVTRDPICLAAANGTLYVGCHLPADALSNSTVSSQIDKIDMGTNKLNGSIKLVNGSQSIKGMTVSGDGSEIYLTHLVSRYTYPTTQLDRGWINTNAFTLIKTATDEAVTVLLDEVELGASNPWDVEICGSNLVFSVSGTGELMLVEKSKLNNRIEKVKAGKDDKISSVEKIVDHVEFLSGIQRRIALGGEGVRDITVSGNTVYAAQYFSGNVVVVDMKTEKVTAVHTPVEQPEATAERIGETIWYSGAYCYQQWESCASCHPDGRADALNWDNLNDGLGNPKNTKSMIFSHRTPPVMITGIRDSAETAVRKGMLFIQFNVMEEGQLDAIDAYLKSLLPTPSPYLEKNGSYSQAAERGKLLFTEVGCAVCHPAPLYTDLQYHTSPYLGSDGTWENRAFVTPTLVEIWRSAPYTYSGEVTSMEEVVRKFANRTLTDKEAADLTEFVLSIGIVGEQYGVEQLRYSGPDGTEGYNKMVPGSTLTTLSLRKQAHTLENPVVTITLYDKNGKVLFEKKAEPGEMVYNTACTIRIDEKIPEDLASGGYIVVTVSSKDQKDLATPLKFIYK